MSSTSRIAKNTLALYFRQILIMLVSLYTSRIVLATLGVIDYGIYNAIGGFVAMFSIISGSMAVAVSRFITIEIGYGNKEKMISIFSTSVSIQLFMAVVVIVVAEVVGGWFLNEKMVIPAERLVAANFVFQCSLVTFAINLLSVPYNAVIIAHEKMSAFAYISILEVFLKLGLAFFLCISSFDKLEVYAILLSFIAILIRFVYRIYCKVKFEETKFKLVFEASIIKRMFSFIGWAFIGNGVVIIKDQGINVLINIFCGPVVNAARGISMQVNSAVYSFVQNFMTAVNPQITTNFAVGNFSEMHTLVIKSAKFGFFITMMLVLPLCANIRYVLGMWLVEVPEHSASFIILVLLCSLFSSLSHSLLTGVLAEGNIKSYEIMLGITYGLDFLVAYILLKLGFIVEFIFVMNILFELIVLAILLYQSKIKYSLSIKLFFVKTIVPCVCVYIFSYLLILLLPLKNAENFILFIIQSFITVSLCCALIFFIGMNKKERCYVKNLILKKIEGDKDEDKKFTA